MRQLDPAALFQRAFPYHYRHLNPSDVLKFPLPEGDTGPRTMFDWTISGVEHEDSETHEEEEGWDERFVELVEERDGFGGTTRSKPRDRENESQRRLRASRLVERGEPLVGALPVVFAQRDAPIRVGRVVTRQDPIK